MDSMVQEWVEFFDGCLARRIPSDIFAKVAVQLHAKSPLPGHKIAFLLFRPRSAQIKTLSRQMRATKSGAHAVIYFEQLLQLKIIDAADVLSVAFHFSKDQVSKDVDEDTSKKPRWTIPTELEEVIFHRLAKAFVADERPVTNFEGVRVVIVLGRWMQAMVTSHTSETMMQAIAGIEQQPQQHLINAREGLGILIVGFLENAKILGILSHTKSKDIRKDFVDSLSRFSTFLSDNSMGSPNSLQLANRLETTQRQHDFLGLALSANDDASRNSALEVAALQLNAVLDLPLPNTRAGIYVFINSLLAARPFTDDDVLLTYLHTRYKLSTQNMAVDLITAAFDTLANAMYRSEPSSRMFYFKSFLINKIPVLLSQISASLFPVTAELSIAQALAQIDPNAFPSFSQGFDDMMGSNNSLSDVKQDFLNSCALRGHISVGSVERLLGETPMQGPPETKYDQNTLFNQFKGNFDKIAIYIKELENLDGNAEAIVGAVTKFITHLCETQTTMYLKQISFLIFKKPQAMDVILQFAAPSSFLQPLCQVLDDWHYDGDHAEYQPVYDEFGAVLVLVLGFVYRYALSYSDLGIESSTFVAKVIQQGSGTVAVEDLTEEQSKHLSNWLKGLYDSDKEGLSNDVFASCRPQDFYLIVPALFQQTVMACSSGVLSFETIKGGLEYLGETFLLPSLICGLSWAAWHALEQTHGDLDAVIRIIKELILSAHTSTDAQAMHAAIISMLSNRLERCFRMLQRRDPSRNNLEPLLQTLNGYVHYERSAYPSLSQLEQWTNAPHSTLYLALRHTVYQLSQWASNAVIQPAPPSYTHHQISATLKILGASKTLRAIIDELKSQTEAGNGSAALDIATSIICAPMTEDSPLSAIWVGNTMQIAAPLRTRANLREMLKEVFDSAANLVAIDLIAAESIVRLHRSVEAQLSSMNEAGLQAPVTSMGIPTVTLVDMAAAQGIPDDISMVIDDATASIVEDLSNINSKVLQQSMVELTGTAGLDLTGMADATVGLNADMGNLPDIDLRDIGIDIDMSMDMGGGGEDDWGLDFDNM